jgi:DNA end-binding protein Ku
MRSQWSGTLAFGLVTLPVGLYRATEEHQQRFHEIRRGTGERVRHRRVTDAGESVERADIVHGVELPGAEEYVALEPSELEHLKPERSKVLQIATFVDLDQINPLYFNRGYYLGPNGPDYRHVYLLLHHALARSNRAGIGWLTMRGKQYLVAIRALPDVIALQTLHYADEVRDPRKEVEHLPEETALSRKELAAAQTLISLLEQDWQPAEYHDTVHEQVLELVAEKKERREVLSAPPTAGPGAEDLMDILTRSIEAASSPEEPAERAKPSRPARNRTTAGKNAGTRR